MERVLNNADISILSIFWQFFFKFFLKIDKLLNYYLHAKFQINWTIQTEITEPGAELPNPLPPPPHTNL